MLFIYLTDNEINDKLAKSPQYCSGVLLVKIFPGLT